jgi:hypothetical protein
MSLRLTVHANTSGRGGGGVGAHDFPGIFKDVAHRASGWVMSIGYSL